MRRFIPIKFFSWLLLVLMLSVAINGVHASAHAGQEQMTTASDTHPCPCSPQDHEDYDGCDSCVNCACHAPLTVQPFQLSYSPIIMNLKPSDPVKHIPEVYLSKFIPPQIHA